MHSCEIEKQANYLQRTNQYIESKNTLSTNTP